MSKNSPSTQLEATAIRNKSIESPNFVAFAVYMSTAKDLFFRRLKDFLLKHGFSLQTKDGLCKFKLDYQGCSSYYVIVSHITNIESVGKIGVFLESKEWSVKSKNPTRYINLERFHSLTSEGKTMDEKQKETENAIQDVFIDISQAVYDTIRDTLFPVDK